MMLGLKVAVTSLCALLVGWCVMVLVEPNCLDAEFRHGAVAADTDTCSKIGRDMLQSGGSAVDGAIAALLCTSLLNVQSLSLGGGTVITVMDSSGDVKVINARETTPLNFKPNLLDECPKSFRRMAGTKWIAVPGEIRGYEEAHRRYGKLPWASLFQPTIQLAREGVAIRPIMARYLAMENYINSSEDKALWKFFSDEKGNQLQAGDIVKYEKLADTLEEIAAGGADALYKGRVGEDLIRDIQEEGGTITMEDLHSYQVEVTDPWTISLGDYKMYLPPPPTGGVLLGLVLNILKGYNMTPSALDADQKVLTYHRLAEALKFSTAAKHHVRDMKFTTADLKKLSEDAFADHLRSLISSDHTNKRKFYNISSQLDTVGTTHVSVLAEDGSAASITSTINHIFGSRVYSQRTGILLNNQLADFCHRVREINHDRRDSRMIPVVYPGERPPSLTSPAILKSDWETLVIGASGGSFITGGFASALMNYLWFGKSLPDAIAAPILFVDGRTVIKGEPGFDEDVLQALVAMGHQREEAVRFFNVVNAVSKKNGCICAVSDARKMGQPAGY
ncbi:gamma-glutamyltransferase 5a isoform X2 [Nelusetta ayraudi]|uniref:gamma-glutamyltransferase 5a isoform X2 n=1 Tax=Nelusetta ayraudi TaxID=303726 RepID=UPI003F6E8735